MERILIQKENASTDEYNDLLLDYYQLQKKIGDKDKIKDLEEKTIYQDNTNRT